MQLVPERLPCPEHPDQELRSLVEAELLANPETVGSAFLGPRPRRRGPQPYLVVVTCPGDAGAPHLQDVEGTWQP